MNKTEIFDSFSDFFSRPDKRTNGVSPKFAIDNPEYKEDNSTNIGCWNCRNCHHCDYCSNCRNCRRCRHCRHCRHCHHCRDCLYCSDCRDCNYKIGDSNE